MKKGVKIEMDRFLFLELYRAMDTYSKDPRHELKVIALDFVARNKEKYDQYNSVVDEVIAYEPRKAVVAMKGDSSTEYLVLRARKLPSGKRQYWLYDVSRLKSNLFTNSRGLGSPRKVSSSSIDRKIRDLADYQVSWLSKISLPKVT